MAARIKTKVERPKREGTEKKAATDPRRQPARQSNRGRNRMRDDASGFNRGR